MSLRPLAALFVVRICIAIFLVASMCKPAEGRRHDLVVMKNGDRLSGDVKKLENGVLYIETDYFDGSTGVDWSLVESLNSSATYQVELIGGKRVAGQIEKLSGQESSGTDFVIREDNDNKEERVATASVVTIESHKPIFWRQLKGGIDVGYSFTSGNSQSTLDLDTNASYLTTSWQVSTYLDSSFNGQSGAAKTNRQDVQAVFSKFLGRNSFLGGLTDLLHSSQQDLDLRATFGGGYGHYLLRSTNTQLSWLTGVVYTHEQFTTTLSQSTQQNVEALLGVQYNLFRFNVGQLTSQAMVFPGLSDAGRPFTDDYEQFGCYQTHEQLSLYILFLGQLRQ